MRQIFLRLVMAFGLAAFVSACSDDDTNALRANGGPIIQVMDFTASFQLDPPPPGWRHQTFWTRPAMELSIAVKDEIPALRCETNGGGSIFGRQTDIDLAQYPRLSWSWFVEVPISSDIDERLEEGDDHPVRFFVKVQDQSGKDHAFEIIWSNRLFQSGDYKYINEFAHYVANGGDQNIGQWHHEDINLLEIYRTITGLDDTPRIKLVSIFCDSDDTDGHSVAYVANVRLGNE
jgi:hypothetical protein